MSEIPPLIAHFVRRFAERQGKVIDDIPDTLVATLRQYGRPGNVRELQNTIERAVIGTSGRTLAEVELEHIVATLHSTHGVIGGWNGAAAKLGLSRTTLISRIAAPWHRGPRWRRNATGSIKASDREWHSPAPATGRTA